jgi:hypothetical protein
MQPIMLASGSTMVLVVTIAVTSSAGCSYQVIAPPVRMINMESAQTAAPRETIVGARGAAFKDVFGPAVGVATVGVRRGVAEQVEIDADATWAYVNDPGNEVFDRNIYAGRLGTKLSHASGNVAFVGGAGLGYAPAGGSFGAADAGVALSANSCRGALFANLTSFVSTPIEAKTVNFRVAGRMDAPETTVGYGVSAGAEIRLDRDRCRRGLTSPRIQLGVSFNDVYPTEGSKEVQVSPNQASRTPGRYTVAGAAIGFEMAF